MQARFASPYIGTIVLTALGLLASPCAFAQEAVPTPVSTPSQDSSTAVSLEGPFEVYASFRDALVEKLRDVKSRAYAVTLSFTDGDLATALLSARLRGVSTQVLLDPNRTSNYASRHKYFAENQIRVVMRPLPRVLLGGSTVLVLDDRTLVVDVPLDSRTRGPVRVYPGPTPEEVEAWFEKQPIKPWQKGTLPNKNIVAKPSTAPGTSAKIPTTPVAPPSQPDTIKTSKRDNKGVVSRRGLPGQTRSQKIETGEIPPESLGQKQGKGTGSLSPVPTNSKREESLTGLN